VAKKSTDTDIMRATLEKLEYGFNLTLDRTGTDQWDRVSVTYNPESGMVTVTVNDEYTWEQPFEGSNRLKPQLF